MSTLRQISARRSSREVPELLSAIFVGELLAPSAVLWLEAPWIADIPVVDNRTDRFTNLAPTLSRGFWRLSQVLAQLVGRGTVVHVATQSDDHNAAFLAALTTAVPTGHPGMRVHCVNQLDARGILGDGFFLGGSLNLTHTGLTTNDDKVTFLCDPGALAPLVQEFQDRWGGA